MAPHSNQLSRDWPIEHFHRLAILCVERLDAVVEFVGTRPQRHSVNRIIRELPVDRYINRCGLLNWKDTEERIRLAACVVSNNSGVGHLAARLGIPTISIFGATHSPLEWMPRGNNVAVIVRGTACSPCLLDSNSLNACPHKLRCLTDIDPFQVFRELCRVIDQSAGPVEEIAAQDNSLSAN